MLPTSSAELETLGIDIDSFCRRAIFSHSRDNHLLRGDEAKADGYLEMLTKQDVH